ncbi:ubiquitin-activating enzyme E1, putative [Plasmodium knowlesi strain H]|uniref:E1 ubiquitin-activating enzyme n=3 Tax=Plasmodium knowlesi TaxID=5850 RepID=A0A1A7VF56_PLAKH|nr:ubiquitin-activating enzyme E1, putative [Plasmodium knowlesi strain H]OTN63847.1 putative Ubiquitin-activating enzyme E1 [Plasmodium knowlesi]CAA9991047.1 ubiquitin-activating enzyme E1, putative [Plasmodium knowlesi strain H]SBO20668.1 ubiquitin-activating enzyme E1, putative [Plasmodium knowlesi strain H]SBO21095.1 ubiquitin-activating enzyme E1, putative [Plasmodium knowlesi strain H]VVS80521.1 ubiquitin-activating enzyme E1, putative [Plasmodium knowlesi strain H]
MQQKNPPLKKQRTYESVNVEEMEGKRENLEGCNLVPKKENGEIDADLYSRQLGTYGFELMNKLIKLNILIVNVKSVGLECAKNLVLSGPKSVCIYDNELCQVSDVGVNFYIDEEDVANKVTRSDAVIKKLKELNRYVHIYNYKGELDENFLQSFDVVVCCDVAHSHLVKYSKMVRNISSPNRKIAFLCCNIYGLCGYLFVDFGKGFVCYDKDGENTKSCNISKISKATEGVVSFDFDKGAPFQKGDYIKFANVEGMTQINNKIYKINDMQKYTFTIGDTSQFDEYLKGGECTQVKSHLRMNFQPYDIVCAKPLAWDEVSTEQVGMQNSPTVFEGETIYEEVPPPQSFLISDYAKCDMSNQLHYAIQALKKYEEENNNVLPQNSEEEAFEKVFQIAVHLNQADKELKKIYTVDEVKKDIVLKVAKYCTAHLAPVASFFGGLLAQEVIKYTGKYMPIYQLLYVDFFECISLGGESDSGIKNDDIAKENSKNDNVITVFGKAFQKRLNELNVFLVGSGALGCEYAKLFSLLDMCSVEHSGKLTITDNDNIEVSNLNRQFLFRRENVGKSKSLVASGIIKQKNPNINVQSLETKVGPENEHIFNETFWEKQHIIVNALDNIQARQYVDNKCVWYSKPLFESGTLGTKGNVQVILPFLTQSYNDSYDPPEDSIPLCTLKHFPYDIVHTIEYARDIFQGLFYNTPLSLQEFLKDKKEYVRKVEEEGNNASLLETLENVLSTLREVSKECNFNFCVKKAVDLFHTNFINQIDQLLYSFPLDYKLASGEFFWVGQKKAPQVISFDINNEFVKEFLFCTSNLFAQVYNIPQCYDLKYILDVASQIEVKPFQPKRVKVNMDEKNLNNISISFVDDEKLIHDFCKELLNIDCQHVKVSPIEFDKDEETNMHVNFIYSFANLRAINYKIETCDKLKAKLVAGKIIPALATTTSIITGLVGIELLKYVNYYGYVQMYVKSTEDKRKQMKDLLSYFKNAFINTALPLILFSEPMPPIKMRDKEYDDLMKGPIKAIPNGFTSWDKIEIHIVNGTIKNLIDHINEKFNIEVNLISVGNACLYNCYLPAHNKERLNRPIHEIYSDITKQKLLDDKNYIVVEASCSDQDLVDVLIPSIKFIYK